MPRAAVHARRDAEVLRLALAGIGLAMPEGAERAMKERHRAIDSNTEDEAADLHFMRGPEEEDAAVALRKALGFAKGRAARAVEAIASWLDAPQDRDAAGAALRALADVCHTVRDSYSRGHARRAPGPGGPAVAAMHSWGEDKEAHRAFGLIHALRYDARFEVPFAWVSPEVAASDAAVAHLLRALTTSAAAPAREREAAFEAAWASFEADHFWPPPGQDGPANA